MKTFHMDSIMYGNPHSKVIPFMLLKNDLKNLEQNEIYIFLYHQDTEWKSVMVNMEEELKITAMPIPGGRRRVSLRFRTDGNEYEANLDCSVEDGLIELSGIKRKGDGPAPERNPKIIGVVKKNKISVNEL